MSDRYADRNSYRISASGDGMSYFRVTIAETDLLIGVSSPPSSTSIDSSVYSTSTLESHAYKAAGDIRTIIEREIKTRPEFQTSLFPLALRGGEPEPIRRMLEAACVAGTGPMAAVAGMVAAYVGMALHRYGVETIVENGGDIFLIGAAIRTVAIAAGESPLSMKLGLRVDPSRGIGVCTSSGTFGHSLSFGKADAAVVVADDCALADAVATMLGNKCKTDDDLASAVEWASALPGVTGAVAVIGESMAIAGDVELTRLT